MSTQAKATRLEAGSQAHYTLLVNANHAPAGSEV